MVLKTNISYPDRGGSNLGYVDLAQLKVGKYVIEEYKNGTDWYRIYNDGWIEQGGTTGLIQTNNRYEAITITFLVPFSNTDYIFTACANKYSQQNGLNTAYPPFIYTKTDHSITLGQWSWTDGTDWVAFGD